MALSIEKFAYNLLVLVLVLTPIIAHAGGLGFVPLVFLMGLAGLVFCLLSRRYIFTRVQQALIVFTSYLCLSANWSPYEPDIFITNYNKLLIMSIALYWSVYLFDLVSKKNSKKLISLILIMSLLEVIVLFLDIKTQYSITMAIETLYTSEDRLYRLVQTEMNLGHAIIFLVLLLSPILVFIFSRYPKYISLTVSVIIVSLIIFASILNHLAIGTFSVIAVLLSMGLGYIYPRFAPRFFIFISILTIILAPVLAYFSFLITEPGLTDLPMSWDHRFRMWGYCWNIISEHPFVGAGFDASRTFNDSFIAKDGRNLSLLSLHPHNLGVQIWTETGLVGAVLASILLLSLIKPLKKITNNSKSSSAYSGVIVASLTISSLTIGAWQLWWWSAVFLALGITKLVNSSDKCDINNF
ncbi:MAG: O-antigen ligase family protein [Hellea sp.]|nr:O-antigen ligase family protein [Hellea sp.]